MLLLYEAVVKTPNMIQVNLPGIYQIHSEFDLGVNFGPLSVWKLFTVARIHVNSTSSYTDPWGDGSVSCVYDTILGI